MAGELTTVDIGKLVKKMNKVYQPAGRCAELTDKPHMQLLINRLRSYTNQVQEEADSNGYAWVSSSLFTPALTEGATMGQWISDMANWRERLAGYQAALDSADVEYGLESCRELYGPVVGPLMSGNYSDATVTSGIVNPRVPSVPDVAMPYTLGNQVKVWQDFQRQNFEALINIIIDEGRRLGRKVARAARRAAPSIGIIGVGVAVAAVGIGWAAGEIKKNATKA